MKTEKVKVIFRVDECEGIHEVIAIFPALAGDSNPYATCLCYVRIGQHGAITLNYATWTRPAATEEYADLKAELESIGYDLQIAKRATYKDFLARKQQTRG